MRLNGLGYISMVAVLGNNDGDQAITRVMLVNGPQRTIEVVGTVMTDNEQGGALQGDFPLG